MVVLASAGGNSVPVIARLVAADEYTVRAVIHRVTNSGRGRRWTLAGRVTVPGRP